MKSDSKYRWQKYKKLLYKLWDKLGIAL